MGSDLWNLYAGLTGCRRILQIMPGNSTDGTDDTYICADGSRWRRIPAGYNCSYSTVAERIGYQHGGFICDHK